MTSNIEQMAQAIAQGIREEGRGAAGAENRIIR